MVRNRLLAHTRIWLLAAVAVLLAATALVMWVVNTAPRVGSLPAVEQPAGVSDNSAERAAQAEAARWEAWARMYASEQQARARQADAARWQGLAELYARANAPASAEAQRAAALAGAARYTGLAILEYQRTGNRSLLPKCLSPEIMALLPPAPSASWRAEVALCSQP